MGDILRAAIREILLSEARGKRGVRHVAIITPDGVVPPKFLRRIMP